MTNTVAEVVGMKGGDIHTTRPATLVSRAVATMNEHRIGSLLVVTDDGELAGIFTERDVLVRIVAAGLSPSTTTIADVMTRIVLTIPPEMPVNDAMAIMTESRYRHLPIVEGGNVRGLISIGDVTKWLIRDREAHIGDLVRYITHP